MANVVKVNKIVLNVNGKEIHLTLEEAKELSRLLGYLFEEKVVVVKEKEYVPYQPYYPYPKIWWSTQTVSNTDGGYTLTYKAST